MKRWIDVIILIVVMVLILPSLIVAIFSKRDSTVPPPIFQPGEEEESIKVKESDGAAYYDEPTITLYNHYSKALEPMPLEEYVEGVLAAEMPASFEMEALKAQAVAARTLAVRKMKASGGSGCTNHKGADVCSQYSHCQAWIPKSQQEKNWGNKYEENAQRIHRAVGETRGYIMTYNDKPIEVFFYSTSNGKTEDSAEVFSAALPYYTIVDSPGEESAPRFRETFSFTNKKFAEIFKGKYPKSGLSAGNLKESIKILNRTESGRVGTLMVGDIKIKATDFRVMYGLNSTDFSFRYEGDKIYIDTVGYGHGVGMSQTGANAMALAGKGFTEILKHYYRGVKLQIFL